MKFRYARHTENLQLLIDFYTKIIGLKILGSFENHANYNGVFLGFQNLNWHIEFTESNEKIDHYPDKDDLIVFYLNSNEELSAIIKDAKKSELSISESKNPYWQENGIEIKDPDGFGVILTIKDKFLNSNDELTQLLKEKEINTWGKSLKLIKGIPYGRNNDRTNFKLVISENKGTCSSKHALLKEIADKNKIENVKLILGIYKMNLANTKGIGNHIKENNLEFIPEAHCYLKINGKRIDLTNNNSDIQNLEKDIINEIEIEPFKVGDFKVDYHMNFVKNWIKKECVNISFEEIWEIREKCIEELAKNTCT